MADGFGAGACRVEVGGFVGGEDRQRGGGVAFGGDIDVGPEGWGGGGEEEGLGEGPGLEVW